MRLTAQLTHRFDHLGHAAAVRRMIVAQPAAVGVERQPSHAGDQVAIRHEPPPLSFRTEAKILDLDEHGDGKAIVDRHVFDFTPASANAAGPPPSLMTQQSSRCNGSATIGELTTSSIVTTLRSIACGLCCAWWEAATLI